MAVEDVVFKFDLDDGNVREVLATMQRQTSKFKEELEGTSEPVKRTNTFLEDQGRKLEELHARARRLRQQMDEASDEKEWQKLGRELDETNRRIGRMNNQVQGFKKTATDALNNLAQVTAGNLLADALQQGVAAMGNFATSAVTTAATFEQAMDRVAAKSGATGEELGKLTELAQRMGSETQFSATQAADAMTALAQAGFDTTQITQALPDVLNLAAVEGLNLADAASIASDQMSTYGFAASDIGRINDILAKTASSSNQSITNVANAFRQSGAIASAAGIQYEELNASLATLANQGIRGEAAGTALRGIISRLSDPPKEAADAIQRLNLEIKNTDGSIRPLGAIFSDLQQRMEELGGTQRNVSTLTQLFGLEAAAAGATLVNSAQDIATFTAELENTSGVAADMAAQMQDNLQGSFNSFNSAVEGLQIRLIGVLMPAIRATVDFFTLLVRALTGTVNVLVGIPQMIRENAAVFGLLGAAILALNAHLIRSTALLIADNIARRAHILFTQGQTAATVALTAAQRALNVAMRANPYGLILGAVTALGTAIYALSRRTKQLTEVQKIQAEITKEANAQFAEEKVRLQELFDQLKQTNAESDERLEIIRRIKQEYPGYLDDISLEKAGLNEIEAALRAVNRALFENIRARITRQKFNTLATQIAQTQLDIEERLRQISENATAADRQRIQAYTEGLERYEDALNTALAARAQFDKGLISETAFNESVRQATFSAERLNGFASNLDAATNTLFKAILNFGQDELFSLNENLEISTERILALNQSFRDLKDEAGTPIPPVATAGTAKATAEATKEVEFHSRAIEADTKAVEDNIRKLQEQRAELERRNALLSGTSPFQLEVETQLGDLTAEQERQSRIIEDNVHDLRVRLIEETNNTMFSLQAQLAEALQGVTDEAQRDKIFDRFQEQQEQRIQEFNNEKARIEKLAAEQQVAFEEKTFEERLKLLNEYIREARKVIKENQMELADTALDIDQMFLNENIGTDDARLQALNRRYDHERELNATNIAETERLIAQGRERIAELEANLAAATTENAREEAKKLLEAARREQEIQETELARHEQEKTRIILEESQARLKLQQEMIAKESEAIREALDQQREILREASQSVQSLGTGGLLEGLGDAGEIATRRYEDTEEYKQRQARIEARRKELEELTKLDNADKERITALQNEIRRLAQENVKAQGDFNKQVFQDAAEAGRLIVTESLDIWAEFTRQQIVLVEGQIERQRELTDTIRAGLDEGGEAAKNYTAEQLELNEERLRELNKQRQAHVNQERTLAQVEVAINTAVAVAKAAAAGGPLAGITIAATLAAMAIGFIKARSAAESAIPTAREGGTVGKGKLKHRPGSWLNVIRGGQLEGPSHEAGGVPIIAEGGEFIVPKGPAAKHAAVLEALRNDNFHPSMLKMALPILQQQADTRREFIRGHEKLQQIKVQFQTGRMENQLTKVNEGLARLERLLDPGSAAQNSPTKPKKRPEPFSKPTQRVKSKGKAMR